MQDPSNATRLERISKVLIDHGVEFIVIGGQAEYLFGSPRVTYDVDLCYRRTKENLMRLAEALRELKVSLRGLPEGLPFIIDERSLTLGANFTFVTDICDFDLLGHVEPIGDYDALAKRATTYEVGDLELKVIDLDDLICIKRHINRPKDRDSLYQLLAIKRVREEEGGDPFVKE